MRAAAASLRERAAGYFVAPRPPAAAEAVTAASRDAGSIPRGSWPRAAVLGPAATAVPVAGALAGALRVAHAAPAAAVAIWAPPTAAASERPPLAIATPTEPGAGATQPRSVAATPAAFRLAARISTRGVPAAGRGRLAWARLADHPVTAALTARRLSAALEVPLVLALAGPRTDVLEGLLREQDLVVVVTRDPEGALARLAVAGCEVPATASAPLPPGPGRLLALAGLSGSRALAPDLRTAVQRLVAPPHPHPVALRPLAADPARSDW